MHIMTLTDIPRGKTADEVFSELEMLVPVGARCINCVYRHNAASKGVNIFCLCQKDGTEYINATDRNAKSCKHFEQKTEKSDEILKSAIKMLIDESMI